MTVEYKKRLLHLLLDLGEAMLTTGAEVNRVEDTLSRMGQAYGASKMNVFVITSSIVVTMSFSEGDEYTQTRRIQKTIGTDFQKLEQLNALSRKCCEQVLDLQDLEKSIHASCQEAKVRMYTYIGSILAAGSFAIFFGGTLADGIIASLFAVVICFLQEYLDKISPNRMIFNLLGSFLAGIGICLISRWLPFLHEDKIIIGDIMLLIPGIPMTNAVRDILVGDTISGIMRLVETLLWAGALACGFMTAIFIIGG